MVRSLRKRFAAGLAVSTCLIAVPALSATTSITRADGTLIETTINSPTNITVMLSGGPQFQNPATVRYNDIVYGANSIVYTGTYTQGGVTTDFSCNLNTADNTVTGSGACANVTGAQSANPNTGSNTPNTGSNTPTTGPGTPTTVKTDTDNGGTTTVTTTDATGDTTTVTLTPSTNPNLGRDFVAAGALRSLAGDLPVTAVMEQLILTGSADAAGLVAALDLIPEAGLLRQALIDLQPATIASGSSLGGLRSFSGAAMGRGSNAGGQFVGINTGDPAEVNPGDTLYGVWLQPFGIYGEEDGNGVAGGYDSRTGGLAVGGDVAVSNDFKLGFALGYSKSDVDGTGFGAGTGVDIESWQGAIYGRWDTESYYLNTLASLGHNSYDSYRVIPFLGSTAKADYDGWQASLRAEGGLPIALTTSSVLTPLASLAYFHTSVDGYSETGAGVANLTVGDQKADVLTGRIGARLTHEISASGITFTPYVEGAVGYDLISDGSAITSRFANFGPSLTTSSVEPDRFLGDVTAGFDVAFENVTLGASYNFEGREGFQTHSGTATVRFGF